MHDLKDIRLRPLTLVLGRNSAGKSRVAHALALPPVVRVGAIRVPLDLTWPTPTREPAITTAGPELLAWNYLYNGGGLIAHVSAWLRRITGYRLFIQFDGLRDLSSDAWAFSLFIERDGQRTNAALAGTGVQQVLPVVIQLVAALCSQTPPVGLLVIEHPEAYLHPAAHAELAELLLAVGNGATKIESVPPVLIETHSETLLLRIRRRIAEGRFGEADPNNHVGIYFVDDFQQPSVTRELRLDHAGCIDDWPQWVFDANAAERRALHLALARQDAGDP